MGPSGGYMERGPQVSRVSRARVAALGGGLLL